MSVQAQTRTYTVNGVSFKMIRVGAGTFMMGATSEQNNPYDNEKPVHKVHLSSFYIGETEVTQALWKAVMDDNPSYTKGDNLPVYNVSWYDCQTFIRKLNAATAGQRPGGGEFRLPTEAEWEFAARGGNKSNHTQYAGGNDLSSVAWYKDNSGDKIHPVAQKRPNELGLYDMSGNVWEFCIDFYFYNYYSHSAYTNPWYNDDVFNSGVVIRGGDYADKARDCRVAHRMGNAPDQYSATYGLRLAMEDENELRSAYNGR